MGVVITCMACNHSVEWVAAAGQYRCPTHGWVQPEQTHVESDGDAIFSGAIRPERRSA